MLKRIFFIIAISSAISSNLLAQTDVSVSFTDTDKKAIQGVTVELLRKSDSALVKTGVSNDKGTAFFEQVLQGNYIIRAQHIGYRTAYVQAFEITVNQPARKLSDVVMEAKPDIQLQDVSVTARKPFIQQLNDRMVVNVENSIVSAGSTALEVLQRSPGVTISSTDVISMRGKSGVIIMIDGKPSAMSGEELVNYLRTLPSSLIQQIDLITNPSAKYDAAGNAGIIDIRLKKNQRLGTNGTFTAGYGQGIYPKANGSISLNNRGKKTNIYGTVNRQYFDWLNNLLLRRDFYDPSGYAGSYVQDNFIKRYINLSSTRLGFDYYINKKSVLGIIFTGSMNNTKRNSANRSDVLNNQQQFESQFTTNSRGRENSRNYLANINFKHSFDSIGKELTIDADYSRFIQDWEADFSSNYFDKTGAPTRSPYLLHHDQDAKLQIKTAKADFVYPVNKKIILETGLKTSFVSANNSVIFHDKSNGGSFIDSSKSNVFAYNENINAAYINLKGSLGKFEWQFGLRGEATNLRTKQIFFNTSYDTSYFQLFPSAYFTHRFSETQSVGISVSRRIDRPTYGQLNPFRVFVDPSFYASGNPTIRPQTTWSYELRYGVKQINISLAYSYTKNTITTVLMPTDNRVTLQTAVNFEWERYYGLTVSTPAKIAKWWNQVNNVNLFANSFRGLVAQTPVDASFLNIILSTNNSFSFSKGWNAELNFQMNSGGKNGVMSDRPFYGLSSGVQKTVMEGKGTVRLNITDILNRSWPRFNSQFTTYREQLLAVRDTRVATISFTYRFGNSKVQAARRRSTASEEERRRAGGN